MALTKGPIKRLQVVECETASGTVLSLDCQILGFSDLRVGAVQFYRLGARTDDLTV